MGQAAYSFLELEDYTDGKSHRDKIEVLQQIMPHVEYSKL